MAIININNRVTLEQLTAIIEQAFTQPQMLAQQQNISTEILNATYHQALDAYQQQQMSSALTAFTYLVMYQPYEFDYLFGLASTLHALEQYQHALVFYGYANLLDARDAGVTFRIAQCYLAIEQTSEAIDALQTSIEQSFIAPIQPDIRRLAQTLLDKVMRDFHD